MKCEDCIHYNVEEKRCSKGLDPNNCEFEDYWADAYAELCEWACENNVYDDVTSMCECWEELEEFEDDEFYEDYEEEDWGYYDEWE